MSRLGRLEGFVIVLMFVILVWTRQGNAFYGHDCAAAQRPVWTPFPHEVRRGYAHSRVFMDCLI